MAIINEKTKDAQFKLIYCGPGYGGKTSNIGAVHATLGEGKRGELVSLSTSTDRTLYFDFLPVNPVMINGYKVRFQLYTTPGQICYGATRQLVLRGVDGIVFVADSHPQRLHDNLKAFQMLQVNLQQNRTHLAAVPWVMQYNKRDLSDALPPEAIDKALGLAGVKMPRFEACAKTGYNVLKTLDGLSQIVLEKLHGKVSQPTRNRRRMNTQHASANTW